MYHRSILWLRRVIPNGVNKVAQHPTIQNSVTALQKMSERNEDPMIIGAALGTVWGVSYGVYDAFRKDNGHIWRPVTYMYGANIFGKFLGAYWQVALPLLVIVDGCIVFLRKKRNENFYKAKREYYLETREQLDAGRAS
jgi:hypothetical protein